MAKIIERVQREREQYEKGLQREGYNSVLAHTHYHFRLRRKAIVKELFEPKLSGNTLEIGSTAWRRFFEQNGLIPANLVCINIAEAELDMGREIARTSRVQPEFRRMDAHKLEFPKASQDIVFGVAVLHHLELETALSEIHRVLKPDGVIAFAEPLDTNPIASLVRRMTPRARTVDEVPFRNHHLAQINQYFDCNYYFEQLTSVPIGLLSKSLRLKPDNAMTRAGLAADLWISQNMPACKWLFRHVLITGHAR